MQLKVVRSIFTPTATLGKMFIDDTFFAYTLEDTDRDLNGDCTKKVQDQTAIDYGTYQVIVDHSEHFKKDLPRVLNVSCFDGIRIHGGNDEKDTEGCILIGAESNMRNRIWNCAGKIAELTARIQATTASEKVFIEVTKEAVIV
jgi:hypothetical protein